MIEEHRDPRIERPHCYLIIFPDAASRMKAHPWLNCMSDILITVEKHILQIKVGVTQATLTKSIRREGVSEFKIYEIDDFEIEDTRTDEEQIDEILDLMNKYGYENLTLENRLHLRNLTKPV